jgi:hypothetical protein
MSKLTLKLLAHVFNQRVNDDPKSDETVQRVKGDVFDARDQGEYDRLVSSGAAVDPDKEHELRKAELERRQAQLEAERAQIDAQLKDVAAEAKPQSSSRAKG